MGFGDQDGDSLVLGASFDSLDWSYVLVGVLLPRARVVSVWWELSIRRLSGTELGGICRLRYHFSFGGQLTDV